MADAAEGELSKNAAKKALKAAEKEAERLKKEAAKAEAAKAAPPKAAKLGEDAEELDPTKYYENRLQSLATMEVGRLNPLFHSFSPLGNHSDLSLSFPPTPSHLQAQGGTPYPHKFHVSRSLPQFATDFNHIADGEHDATQNVSVAGRILSKRGQGKLMFYDLHADGCKIQIMSDLSQYEGGEEAFRVIHTLIKRGDIVGVNGFPGKSKKGELSIFPTKMTLLSACLHMLPTGYSGLKNQEVRYRQRYLDLILNSETRRVFDIRSKVIFFSLFDFRCPHCMPNFLQ